MGQLNSKVNVYDYHNNTGMIYHGRGNLFGLVCVYSYFKMGIILTMID